MKLILMIFFALCPMRYAIFSYHTDFFKRINKIQTPNSEPNYSELFSPAPAGTSQFFSILHSFSNFV